MMTDKVKIKCETEGFEEAIEQVEALVEAYDGFPPQVQIKGCHNCPRKPKYIRDNSIPHSFADFSSKCVAYTPKEYDDE